MRGEVVHSWGGANLERDGSGYGIYVPPGSKAYLANPEGLAERFGFRGHRTRVCVPYDRSGVVVVVLPLYRYRCAHELEVGPAYCPECKADAEAYYSVHDSDWLGGDRGLDAPGVEAPVTFGLGGEC